MIHHSLTAFYKVSSHLCDNLFSFPLLTVSSPSCQTLTTVQTQKNGPSISHFSKFIPIKKVFFQPSVPDGSISLVARLTISRDLLYFTLQEHSGGPLPPPPKRLLLKVTNHLPVAEARGFS